jgi:hypothetical protein
VFNLLTWSVRSSGDAIVVTDGKWCASVGRDRSEFMFSFMSESDFFLTNVIIVRENSCVTTSNYLHPETHPHFIRCSNWMDIHSVKVLGDSPNVCFNPINTQEYELYNKHQKLDTLFSFIYTLLRFKVSTCFGHYCSLPPSRDQPTSTTAHNSHQNLRSCSDSWRWASNARNMSRLWTSIKCKWKWIVYQVGCVYYVITSL